MYTVQRGAVHSWNSHLFDFYMLYYIPIACVIFHSFRQTKTFLIKLLNLFFVFIIVALQSSPIYMCECVCIFPNTSFG